MHLLQSPIPANDGNVKLLGLAMAMTSPPQKVVNRREGGLMGLMCCLTALGTARISRTEREAVFECCC